MRGLGFKYGRKVWKMEGKKKQNAYKLENGVSLFNWGRIGINICITTR
jgi:hypothetical protein